MTYRVGNFSSFGGDYSWWDGYSVEKIGAVAGAINATRASYGLSEMRAVAFEILRAHARSTEEGGGFVIPLPDGTQHCLCIGNTAQDITRQISGSDRCPPGTGGQAGTNVGGDPVTLPKTMFRPIVSPIFTTPTEPRRFKIDQPSADEDTVPLILPSDGTEFKTEDAANAGDEDAGDAVPPPPWYKNPWVWVGGVAAVGAVAGGVYLARRKR